MNTKCIVLFVSALGAAAGALHAGPRTSANYNILTDALDYGGVTASSANYQNAGSAGLIGGIASTASGAEVNKSGYVGQLVFGGSVVPINIVSRKVHGPGAFDIALPLTGAAGVECRRNTGADSSGPNAGRDHEVIVTFAKAVTVAGASVTSGVMGDMSTATFSVSSNVVTVDLHNIVNARRLTINLTNVSDGTNTSNIGIPMGVLLGDTTGNGIVNSSDVGQTKSKSGQAVDASNFRTDVTVSNSINSSDVSIVKSKSGTALP